MNEPSKNLDAIFLGIGEFSFAPGATTRAEALAKGYRDVGNIQAFTPEVENTKEEHEGSYRTGRRVDKIFSTKQKVEYLIRSDEWNAGQVQMLLMAGDPDGDNAVAIATATAADSMVFSTNNSVSDRWYEFTIGGTRRKTLTSVVIASSPATSCTVDASTDTVTSNAHGLSNGATVFFSGTAVPTGLSAGTVYYVINSATNTFKVSATLGGSAVDITTAGTAVTWLPALVEDTNFEIDRRLGRVRFLTTQSGTVYPYLTAAAITSSSAAYAKTMQPMQNGVSEGYGRLVIFDPEKQDRVMIDHYDFSCSIVVERVGEIDGKKPSEITLRVTVTKDEGLVDYADSLSQTA